MEWSEIRAGDTIRLTRKTTGRATCVTGVVKKVRGFSLSLEDMTYTYVEDGWSVDLIERPWSPPTEAGLYVRQSSLGTWGLGHLNVAVWRRNSGGCWFIVGDNTGVGKSEAEIPRDLVRLLPAGIDTPSDDDC